MPPGLLAGITSQISRRLGLDDLSRKDFAAQLNTAFRIHVAPGKSIEVTLTKLRVKAGRPFEPGQIPPGDAGHERFSLLFSGARSERLEQETYTFDHETLGQFDCFIVPIGTRDPRRIYYEMICNRPRGRKR